MLLNNQTLIVFLNANIFIIALSSVTHVEVRLAYLMVLLKLCGCWPV
jgi:hypothetical protein